MSAPRVVAVAPGTAGFRAGLAEDDELLSVNGRVPRDVIEYRLLVDEEDPELEVRRGGLEMSLVVHKRAGEPLGAEISSAVFDRVRTCDNHCEFCFIHQLPRGLRRSLYLQDDDYRLSFLYGNFTTLTRFTEADFERVVTERLSPLFVSIHATDPVVRSRLLRNPRGATSLRWLSALLEAGIEIHGQVVVCPGVNDGDVLSDTLCGILDRYPELQSVGVVPLGVSRFSREPSMRPHTTDEARLVVDLVESYQSSFLGVLGRRMVFAADEYYLLAGRPFPSYEEYEGFPQHENGIGMAAALKAAFGGDTEAAIGAQRGFFSWVDGAPAAGYRSIRVSGDRSPGEQGSGIAVVTGTYGERVLKPLLASAGRKDVRVVTVENRFFGGNIGVAGLLVGEDLRRALADQPEECLYLIPDVCLTEGRFLDGTTPADLPRTVRVVGSDGESLRQALGAG